MYRLITLCFVLFGVVWGFISFLETIAWMIPMVILENVASYFLIKKQNLPEQGLCSKCILSDFIQVWSYRLSNHNHTIIIILHLVSLGT